MTALAEDIRAYFADFQEVMAFTQEAARLAQLVSFLLRHSQQAPHQHPSAGERVPEQ